MIRIIVLLVIANIYLLSSNVCQGCHGANYEKRALGRSQIIKNFSYSQIVSALKGYKDGTYGGFTSGIMKSQVANLSESDMADIASDIATKVQENFDNKELCKNITGITSILVGGVAFYYDDVTGAFLTVSGIALGEYMCDTLLP